MSTDRSLSSKLLCPSSADLSDFDLGKLSGQRSSEITQHISACETCRAAHWSQVDDDDKVTTAFHVTNLVTTDAYIDEPEFRRIHELLLAAPERMPHDVPNSDETTWTRPFAAPIESFPFRLGNYELLEPIGHGAMGYVYRARHVNLKRNVALKVLRAGRMKKSLAIARFQRELEAVGRLNDPHIITAHDAGEVDGRHILVTEFVDGFDLAELVHRLGPLPKAEACELIRQSALGLQAAHQHGMVHHDIKPSNLMVTTTGQVKVLDLGLVSFLSSREHEDSDVPSMGTPDYMAPERWRPSGEVDIRGDIYSLGCTLFKLLAGHAPFSQRLQSFDEKLDAHLSGAVPSIRQSRKDLPPELERTVYRMLAKSPSDRFTAPADVARALTPFANGADLRRLVGQATKGAPLDEATELDLTSEKYSATSHGWRFWSSLAASVALISVLGAWLITSGFQRATSPLVQSPTDVESTPGSPDSHEQESDNPSSRIIGGAVDPHPPLRETITEIARIPGHGDSVPCVDISPDGALLVSSGIDGTVRLWNIATETEIHRFTGHQGPVPCVVFSPDGNKIATAGYDGSVRLWDVQSAEQTHMLVGHVGLVNSVDFSPDGRRLVSAGLDGLVRIWDSSTGTGQQSLQGHTGLVRSVEFSSDGQSVVSAGQDATVILWDAGSGRIKRVFQGHNTAVSRAVVSTDGRYVFSGGLDRLAILWDADTEESLRMLDGHSDTVFNIALIQSDRYALTTGADSTMSLWDLQQQKRLSHFQGHEGYVLGITLSRDGRRIVTSGQDGTIRIWPVPQLPNDSLSPIKSPMVARGSPEVEVVTLSELTWLAHEGGVLAVSSTQDHGAVSGGRDGILRCWNGNDAQQRWAHDMDGGAVSAVAVSHDGSIVAAGDTTGQIVICNQATGQLLRHCHGHSQWISSLAFSSDDQRLVSGSFDRTVRQWSIASGSERFRYEGYGSWVRDVIFDSGEDRVLCTGNRTGVIRLEHDAAVALAFGQSKAGHMLASLQLSPDRRLLAAAGWTRKIRLWDYDTGTESSPCVGHQAAITDIAFTPDGLGIASASYDNSVRLWNVSRSIETHRFLGHQGPVRALDISPDGNSIISGGSDGTLRVWKFDAVDGRD